MELLAKIILGEYAEEWAGYFSYLCIILQILYYILKDYSLTLMSILSKTSLLSKTIINNTLKNIWKYYPYCQKQYFSLLCGFHKGFY